MRVAVITATFGGHDAIPNHVEQCCGYTVDVHVFHGGNFPDRRHALSPRMTAKIPKMFGWDLRPGYDAYIWLDASLRLSRDDSVSWFMKELGDADIAIFDHLRKSVHEEEVAFRVELSKDIANGGGYIADRYQGEDLDGEMAAFDAVPGYVDDRYYSGGAFCYRPTESIKAAMKEWWYRVSRFHVCDQYALPQILRDCRVNVIHSDIYHHPFIQWVRPREKSCMQAR